MTENGPRIHFTISSHGYGHLSQSAALIRELTKQLPDTVFRIQCNLPGKIITERIGSDDFEHDKCSTDIGLIQKDPITPDLDATYCAYKTLHENFTERVAKESKALKNWQPDLVISDIPYLPLAAASRVGIPSVALASLTWDKIIGSYFDLHESAPAKWYADARTSYGETELALLPSPAMNGDCFSGVKQIPPIAVLGKRQANLRSDLNIKTSDKRPLILCSLGGISGAKLPISVMKKEINFHWLTNISDRGKSENIHSLDTLTNWQFRDIIASVDAVISKPGYGMAVETAAHGLPIVFFRRGNFPDEPHIIEWLHRNTRTKEISSDDWAAGKFVKPLMDLISSPKTKSPHCNGAEVGALMIRNQFFSHLS